MHAEMCLFPVSHDGNSAGIVGVVSLVCRPGRGGIRVPGRVGAGVMDAVEVAVSWASSQLRGLWRWLGRSRKGTRRRCPARLWRSNETLLISFGTGHRGSVIGGSLGPATALSLVSILTRRPVKPTVAVTGLLDLRGNVLGVGSLQAKLRACKEGGIETLLVPATTLAVLRIESLPVDLRDYAYRSLRGVQTMTDVIRLCIQGQPFERLITSLSLCVWLRALRSYHCAAVLWHCLTTCRLPACLSA